MGAAVKWGGIALVVFIIVTQPQVATDVVHGVLGFVHQAAQSATQVVSGIAPSSQP